MKHDPMADGAAKGMRHQHPARVFAWLWKAWLEAGAQVPLLRWLGALVIALVALAVYRAFAEGRGALECMIYGMTVLLFAMAISAIIYLLFEIYRKHRSDAIFSGHRLTELIRSISRSEIAAEADARAELGNAVFLLPGEKPEKRWPE